MESQKTILSIDDSPSNQELISRVLADEYHVTRAMSGDEGIALLNKVKPELILLDVDMPGINGFETCRKIRQEENHRETPILFLTCMTDPADQMTGFRAGANDYLSKPADIDVLKAKIALNIKKDIPSNVTNNNDAILIALLKSLLRATTQEMIVSSLTKTFEKLSLDYAFRLHRGQTVTNSNIQVSALEDILLDQAENNMPESHSARLVLASSHIVLIVRNAEHIAHQRMAYLTRKKRMFALRDFLHDTLKSAQVRINQI